MTPITLLPTERKPRERLRKQGVEALSLEELLCLIIRTGLPTSGVVEVSATVSQALLAGKDSFTDLAAIPGVGTAKSAELVAALHLSAALSQRRELPLLANAQEVYRACQDLLEETREQLVVFYLTVRNRQITRETVSLGTATASLVHPREIFRPAISHNASQVILAHNHPSGDPHPSQADLQATERLARAGREIGIELLDHVICAASGYVSLKEVSPELFD